MSSVSKKTSHTAEKFNTGNSPRLPNILGLEARIYDLENTTGSTGTVIDVDTNPSNSGVTLTDVGKAVRISSGANPYALAQGDSESNAEILGIISEVSDLSTFSYVQIGKIELTTTQWNNACDESIPTGLTRGTVYFLSETNAGQFTSTPPEVDGEVIKALFIGSSTTEALVVPYVGATIGSGISKGTFFTQGNFNWNAIDEQWEFDFTHGLNNKYPDVYVRRANGAPVQDVLFKAVPGSETSATRLIFSDDLYNTLDTETWYLRVVGNGENANVDISSADPLANDGAADPGSSGEYSDAEHKHPGMEWAFIYMSGNQSSNISNGDHVEFDIIQKAGDMSLATGAGQADGIITLKADKTYKLYCRLRCSYSAIGGNLTFQWYDRTNGGYIGRQGQDNSITDTSNAGPNGTPSIAYIKPATDIEVEVRLTIPTAMTAVQGTRSEVFIDQVRTEDT